MRCAVFAGCILTSICSGQSIITTVAGSDFLFPLTPLPALKAPLGNLGGIAVDASRNVYLADSGNHRIFRITPAGVLTVATGNGLVCSSGEGVPAISSCVNPLALTIDRAGNLYFSEFNRIRKMTPGGILTTVAGGRLGFSGDGGPATSAALFQPSGVAADLAGNLYIADTANSRIRKVSADGIITTFAGNGTVGFSGDGGPATSAALSQFFGMVTDPAGNLYLSEVGFPRLRKISPQGVISSVSLTLSATDRLTRTDKGIALDASGNLFFSDANFIRKATPGGVITTAATVDGSGSSGLAVDSAGNIYSAEAVISPRVFKVSPAGDATVFAGGGSFAFSGDNGPAVAASLNQPGGVALDRDGNLIIADTANNRIRRVTPAGTITTIAGNGATATSGDNGPAVLASLNSPGSVAFDPAGNLYFTQSSDSRIRTVSAAGTIRTIAGGARSGFSGDGGPAAAAALAGPRGLAFDAAGNLYFCDAGNRRIRKITPAGVISTVAGNSSSGFSGNGGPALSASLSFPVGLAVDRTGNLYIADQTGQRVRKVAPDGIITTAAGNGIQGFSGDGGPAASASLAFPVGVAVDASGNLFIAEQTNNRVRKVSPSGTITTVAGNGLPGYSGDGGPATAATIYNVNSVALDSSGSLYIADTLNNRIRKVLASPPAIAASVSSLAFSGAAGGAPAPSQAVLVSSEVP